ncbi:D-sedoheptulose 7-phosphate isomerase [Massilia sp. CFBP9026]|uniref:D-sedoheptulose 7-phosphate isomerase n=1 Tax=Massilia sp. CFBP9026 TaxID=3096536 RepID=UPI002A6A57E5|nr:D-sedoheptulose 7-phosphate isomerase [Massilia sp. CFBP9026]MDY0962491.1 D-sedoheptulose 7-phosphate isomerase [Massilia sp. CFBP9026]
MFKESLQNHLDVFSRLLSIEPELDRAIEIMYESLKNDDKLMFCGNGGSAADSQHLAAEFVGRYINDRPPIAAIALSTDTSALTCISNDYGYEHVFSRQVSSLGRAGDTLIGISTSGNSANVIRAVEAAKQRGVHTVALLGRDGGALKDMVDVAIVVPSNVTAHIQEAHIFIGHHFCSALEQKLGY